jgi:hypothetical protein
VPVVEVGQSMPDGDYASRTRQAIDTGEQLHLTVLGTGLSGWGAAYYHRQAQGAPRPCLILENHARPAAIASRMSSSSRAAG